MGIREATALERERYGKLPPLPDHRIGDLAEEITGQLLAALDLDRVRPGRSDLVDIYLTRRQLEAFEDVGYCGALLWKVAAEPNRVPIVAYLEHVHTTETGIEATYRVCANCRLGDERR